MGKRARDNEREEEKNELVKMSKYSETGLAQKEDGVKLDHVTNRERLYANMHLNPDVCFSTMVGTFHWLFNGNFLFNSIFCLL